MSEHHVEDLIPAYALGSLDREEKELVDAHLAGCSSCQESLREYEAVVEELPFGMPLSEPPPGLRQKILDRAASESAPDSGTAQPGWRARLQGLFAAVPAWGWMGLALVVILGVSNLLLWRQLQDRPNPNTLMVFTLQGTEEFPLGEGLLVLNQGGTTGTLVVDQLAPLGEEREYQLWLISGEERTSGAVFSVDEDGYGRAYVHLPAPLADYSSFGVTIEPAGGSPGPTGPKVLGADL